MGSCQSHVDQTTQVPNSRAITKNGQYSEARKETYVYGSNSKLEIRGLRSPSEMTSATVPETPRIHEGTSFNIFSPQQTYVDVHKMEASTPNLVTPSHVQEMQRARHSPLIAPPKGTTVPKAESSKTSVTPQTIAHFNRLKIQVELDQKNRMQSRKKEKIEDRIVDVEGYRNLWQDYEQIQEQVQEESDRRDHHRSRADRSMDLHEPTSWYFDFHALKQQRYLEGDEDSQDSRSLSTMSLLSDVGIEAQRKYFQAKLRQRRKGKNIHPNTVTSRDERSTISARSMTSRGSRAHLRSQKSFEDSDYGPTQELSSIIATEDSNYIGSDDSTPRTRTGRADDTQSKATTFDETSSLISDLGAENDYHVVRRRRRRSFKDDSSIETYTDKSLAKSKFEFDLSDFEPRTEGKRKKVGRRSVSSNVEASTQKSKAKAIPTSPNSRIEHYGFDPSAPLSSQLEIFAQSVPSVQIDNAQTGVVRWREFVGEEEPQPKTARKLEGMFDSRPEARDESFISKEHASHSKEGKSMATKNMKEQKLQRYTSIAARKWNTSATPSPALSKEIQTVEDHESGSFWDSPYASMSPDHFLMMSSCNATVEHSESDENSHSEEDSEGCVSNSTKRSSRETHMAKTAPVSSIQKQDESSISFMSTEAFLRMSNWNPSPATIESPLMQTQEAEEEEVPTSAAPCIKEGSTCGQQEELEKQTPAPAEKQIFTPTSLVSESTQTEVIADQVAAAVDDLLMRYRDEK